MVLYIVIKIDVYLHSSLTKTIFGEGNQHRILYIVQYKDDIHMNVKIFNLKSIGINVKNKDILYT